LMLFGRKMYGQALVYHINLDPLWSSLLVSLFDVVVVAVAVAIAVAVAVATATTTAASFVERHY
jgi:hypothetical protein